ncbi:hypothetical protein BOW91_gp059 [Synechococcus phage S-WAM2]|uniref:Uncharacterized protein n=1 Tax=Synechococcus phage S-WAM2 TaxID=1815522 RepID=A0A1D8KTG8_9CAUD|nr:hypothetical protein BOW91_gp059 [Synechococcus phage S-WAM2]AOV61887.1 hypothetical protein P29B0810_192 [Synechococcus phage S-WAM2]
MAINFPSTAGQATDGSYTYTVAGITYSWDGSSWRAAGAGASATDKTLFSVTQNAAGTAALSYNSNTGVFSYTPPDLSSYAQTSSLNIANWDAAFGWGNHASAGYLTAEADTLNTVTGRGATTTNNITVGRLTAGGLTYPTSNGTSGQALISDGAGNVNWGSVATTGLQSRSTAQVTQSIANNTAANVSFTTPKTYALLKIETSHAAWVTLYSDTASRTADSTRNEQTDPTPGSGVLAEVITAGGTTQLITPGTICFNSGATGTTYAKIVNKSGATNNITVTLTYVQIED